MTSRLSSSSSSSGVRIWLSRICDSSRNWTTSWPCSARSALDQPSYCLSSRRVALPAHVRELEGLALVVGDLEALELVVEQDLLQLGLLLDVALRLPCVTLYSGGLAM